MSNILPYLERLGLEQYHETLVAEGFDNWEILLDIQEKDLEHLGIKLGHRRKLQRAIAETRGFPSGRPLGTSSGAPHREGGIGGSIRADDNSKQGDSSRPISSTALPEPKRKYRRRPKVDEHAPEKPPSAYVLFSNKIREEVKEENLSFTEIARLVGERWQKLEPREKEIFETQATSMKETYNTKLTEYKKTDQYREYAAYLAEFKARHGGERDVKRPKIEYTAESSTSIGDSSEWGPNLVSPARQSLSGVSSFDSQDEVAIRAVERATTPPTQSHSASDAATARQSSPGNSSHGAISSEAQRPGSTVSGTDEALRRAVELSLDSPMAGNLSVWPGTSSTAMYDADDSALSSTQSSNPFIASRSLNPLNTASMRSSEVHTPALQSLLSRSSQSSIPISCLIEGDSSSRSHSNPTPPGRILPLPSGMYPSRIGPELVTSPKSTPLTFSNMHQHNLVGDDTVVPAQRQTDRRSLATTNFTETDAAAVLARTSRRRNLPAPNDTNHR